MTRSTLHALLTVAAIAAATTNAGAVPSEGAARPSITLVDAWDRSLSVPTAGKPVLVIYEDKDSAKQNEALKRDLAELAKGGRYRSAVTLLPVADVAGYDYWPVRGFVKDAIKGESRNFDTPIYCDWDASVRRTLGLRGGVSNVVLYSRTGKVVFAREGTLLPDERAKLLSLLRAELGKT